MKLNVFAFVGITASLTKSFKPSAKGCNNPKKPTEFGPNLCCIEPITFRSAKVKYATLINTGKIRAKKDSKISIINIQINNCILVVIDLNYQQLCCKQSILPIELTTKKMN